MKLKKYVSLALMLAVFASSMAVNAVAEDQEDDGKVYGEAGISFIDGDTGIVEPPESTPGIKGNGLKFGTWERAADTQTYYSTNPDVEIDDDDRYAGLAVANPNKKLQWDVTVSISDFKIENQVTIPGFTLVLRADEESITGENKGAPTIPDEITLTSTSGSATAMTPQADLYAGTFGVNFAGELTVLGSTADEGDATAVMTWNFQSAPVQGD